MKIAIDAFGGDNAPLEIIKGAILARDEKKVGDFNLILVGDESHIKACAAENNLDLKGIEIQHAATKITMTDDPNVVVKEKKDSSMAVGLKLVAAGDAQAFLSAGNTGAIVMGSTFLAKRIRGIERAALAAMLPTKKIPVMVLDVGANIECKPQMLLQFGLMASVYMENVENRTNPTVGLLNIGAEESKGTPLQTETYKLLKNSTLNFIGNIEAREVPHGNVDIIVADGFSGNLVLKLTEGLGLTLMGMMKNVFMSNILTKFSALMVRKSMLKMKNQLDYTEYGGAPLMGISKPVIKAHGSSNAKAIKNAIYQAVRYEKSGAITLISEMIKTENDNAT